MKIGLIVLIVIALAGMIACSKYVSVRNDLVTQREAVTAAWSTVDVALQRRADLIPNLVNTVKGFAAHETEVFKNISDARAAMAGARTPGEKIQANDQLSGALSRLLDLREERIKPRDVDAARLLASYMKGISTVIDAVDRVGK